MKKIKFFSNVFFGLSFISIILSIYIAFFIGEVDVFGLRGIIKYSWIVLFCIPICLCSLVFGILLKSTNRKKYIRNIFGAIFCLIISIEFGSFRLTSKDITYDENLIYMISEKTNLNLPKNIKVMTQKCSQYNIGCPISIVKIMDNDEKEYFENEIKNNKLWLSKCDTRIRSLLPPFFQFEFNDFEEFEYFTFYNISKEEYNSYSPNDGDKCVFIAYDCDLQRLLILDDYEINLEM